MLRILCNNFIPSIPNILSWWKYKISQIIDIKFEKYTQYKLSFVVKKWNFWSLKPWQKQTVINKNNDEILGWRNLFYIYTIKFNL